MKRVVILTGAGISAESGLKTFRDSGGLWEGSRVEDVATPEAWERDPQRVLQFYNERRKSVLEASPNEAHLALVKLEEFFDVHVITQNVDNLHERAGSSNVLHLHGEITKARSTKYPDLVIDLPGPNLDLGDLCPKGAQLRPHIVWFGEAVPMMDAAIEIVFNAEIVIVVGTSFVVYPAAGLMQCAPFNADRYVVDLVRPNVETAPGVTFIEAKATEGVPLLVERLISDVS